MLLIFVYIHATLFPYSERHMSRLEEILITVLTAHLIHMGDTAEKFSGVSVSIKQD